LASPAPLADPQISFLHDGRGSSNISGQTYKGKHIRANIEGKDIWQPFRANIWGKHIVHIVLSVLPHRRGD